MRQLNGGRIVEGTIDERKMVIMSHMIWNSPQYPNIWHEPEQWSFEIGIYRVTIMFRKVEDSARDSSFFISGVTKNHNALSSVRIRDYKYDPEDLSKMLEEVLLVVDIGKIMDS